MAVEGNDTGIGLAAAQVLIDGTVVDSKGFGGAGCPGVAADLALDEDCPHVRTTHVGFDSNRFPDGDHAVAFRVFDAAGNMWEKKDTLRIENHIDLGSATQTLTIGTTVPSRQGTGGNGTGSGGVAGATAGSCRSPKLTMLLDQKPLRISKGAPVLKRGRTYRFRGRLTCVIGTRRTSAPRRTRIQLLNLVGKKTVEKSGTTVRSKGAITMLLRYYSSRTLIFRFENGDGRRAQVKIKVKIARG
jgi:hypothetical protein